MLTIRNQVLRRRAVSLGFLAIASTMLVSSVTALTLGQQDVDISVRELCLAYLFWYASSEIDRFERRRSADE